MDKPETTDYGSAHAYAEALRKWIGDVQCWYAVNQAIQMQMASGAAASIQVGGNTQNINISPAQTTLILTPDGQRLLTARYTVATMGRRILAELIDCVFAFALKLILVYMLIECEIIDLDRYERLISDHADLQTLIEITHELFPLEIVGKILCSVIEAFLISYGFGALPPGMTPGKSIMGLRVISCRSAMAVAGDPNSVTATGYDRVPFKASLTRALFKNILVNSLIPISSIVYVFNFNRSLYDMLAGTVVVRFGQGY